MSKHSNRFKYHSFKYAQRPQHSPSSLNSPFVKKPFGLCHSEQPFIANAIRQKPSAWSEIPLTDVDRSCEIIEGADIQFPILGDEYRVDFWFNEIGASMLKCFITNLQEAGNVRLLACDDTEAFYICTEADANAVATASIAATQILMQSLAYAWRWLE